MRTFAVLGLISLVPLLAAADFSEQTLIDFTRRDVPSYIPPVDAEVPAESQDPPFGTRQEGYVSSDAFTSRWTVQSWGKWNSPVTMINSLSNVYIDNSTDGSSPSVTSKLVLRTHRLESGQTAAEIDSANQYLYASVRVLARVRGSSGACAGIFTYASDTAETDSEILTKDSSSTIHYTNQPGWVDGATTEYDLSNATPLYRRDPVSRPRRSYPPNVRQARETAMEEAKRELQKRDIVWTDWHEHRFDWVPGKTTWFIDGMPVVEKTIQVPDVESYIILNAWSDGGEWTGEMEEDGEVTMEIEYIDIRHD